MTHKCSFCGETDSSKFYGRKRTRCASCHNKDVMAKAKANKLYVIEKMGGCCRLCGYSKCPIALEVHHLDPGIKDKNFSHMNMWARARIDKEIAGCALLCANCHREVHAGYTPQPSGEAE